MPEGRLTELVRRWIRAEHVFRFGSRAYTKQAEEWLLEAEQRLRKVVTGKRQLVDAYEVLNAEGNNDS